MTAVLPEPFGPTSLVTGINSSVGSRSDLKPFTRSLASLQPRGHAVGAAEAPPVPRVPHVDPGLRRGGLAYGARS